LEVGKLPVESVARLNVIRDGRPRTLDVTLAKYPVRGRKIVTTPAAAWRGMRIDYPTAVVDGDSRAQSRMVFYDDGVLVTDVREGTPAWEAGLRPGMRIGQVGRTPVRTPKQFWAAVAGQRGPVQLRLAGEDEKPLRTVGPES
jgi:serine protease Do